jgi:hypothetical protein
MGGFTYFQEYYGHYLGLKIHGTVGKKYTYQTIHNRQIKYRYTVPFNPNSQLQQYWRESLRHAVLGWHNLSVSKRAWYRENKPSRPAMSGFNWFISRYLDTRQP